MLGFQDEVWWSRLKSPELSSWCGGEPLRLVQQERVKGDGPQALACYGILRRDTGALLLRFVAGRPVSGVTEEFLGWACGEFAREGKKVFVLVWDNAPWHVSKRVKAWIESHNAQVAAGWVPDRGVRAADQGSLAERDRAEVDAWQEGDRRADPDIECRGTPRACPRLLRVPA